MLKKHKDMLKAIYDAHRIRDARSGQRSKQLKVDQWHNMMDACLFVDKDFTFREASLCFVWARTIVTDEAWEAGRVVFEASIQLISF